MDKKLDQGITNTELQDEVNNDYRFFICNKGSLTDLEEIYVISQPTEGYGEYEGQWRFKALAKLDGKPLEFMYTTYNECLDEQKRMAESLVAYRVNRGIKWDK